MRLNQISVIFGGYSVFLLIFSQMVSGQTVIQENIESYTVVGTRIVQRCYPCSYTTCTDFKDYRGWLCYRSCCYQLVYSYWYLYERKCTTITNQNCCNYQETYTETRYQCKTGWINYPYCNVATCNPECKTGQICKTPNNCVCETGATSAVCTNVPCSDEVNCYPGTCSNKNSLTCSCPPGFQGTNCLQITLTPVIPSCTAVLYANPGSGEKAVGSVDECAAVGLAPPAVWVGLNALNSGVPALTKIDVSWTAEYGNPRIKMPDRTSAPFVLNSPVSIGVTKSEYKVTLFNAGSTGVSGDPVNCPNAKFDDQFNPTTADCRNIARDWSFLGLSGEIAHGTSLIIDVSAQLGGQKKGAGSSITGGYFGPQNFNSTSVTRSMNITFDFKPPTHCASKGRNDSAACSVYPIYLEDTITRKSRIQPQFNVWQDEGSGINNFAAAVYYMKANAQDLLVEDRDPLPGCTSQDVSVSTNNFVCDLPKPGTYSIIVTAFDWAGNSAQARKIVTYTGDIPSINSTTVPITVTGTNPNSDNKFITDLATPSGGRNYTFNVDWSQSFKCNLEPEWMKAVKPWEAGTGIDDLYGASIGLRSTNALSATDCLLSYEFELYVDGGGALGAQPTGNGTTFTDDTGLTFTVPQQYLLNEGSTMVMWVTAYALDGKKYRLENRVSVHRSRADIKVENPQFITEYKYKYNSSFKIDIKSEIGGIKNISFDINDRTVPNSISKGVLAILATRDWPYSFGTREKRQVPQYPNTCQPSDFTCYCIPLGLCYNISQYYVIDNCLIDRYAGHELEIIYRLFTMSGYEISNADSPFIFTVDANKVKCRPTPKLTGGEIAAIVICSLIFLLLLLLLLLLLWRWRQKKHPIPTRVRTIIRDMRHRYSNSHTTDNVLYVAGEDIKKGPAFKKNNLDADILSNSKQYEQSCPGKHDYESLIVYDRKSLNVGTQTLGEGRFASIKTATIQEGNHNIKVAIKALRHGYSKQDAELMKRKITELSTLSSHPNLVNLKGVYKDELYSKEPVMVLDYCDTPLTSWLNSLKDVNPDDLESMLNYSKDIASGMEHLHDNNIIHRRLTAKNVLLSKNPYGSVAKVTGFGPSIDDVSDGKKGTNSSLVKIKWLAPETISTIKSSNPEYNEQTDAWSYGVTLWEMYSKGEAPYDDIKSSEVLKQLQKGYRLPRPELCPPDLYERVMHPCWNADSSRRPGFNDICSKIDYFKSGGTPQGYYGADDVGLGYSSESVPEGYYAPDMLDSGKKQNIYRSSDSFYNDAS